jgi:hypothetical protein
MEAHMAELKIKVRIGPNEFEAEGPQEIVEKHFETFTSLVSQSRQPAAKTNPVTGASDTVFQVPDSTAPLARVFHQEGRFVSLIGRPSGENRELDAALLILLGHKELRNADAVSADELLYGLKQTGYSVDRSDRLMGHGESQGLVTRNGIRRGTKYRLTIPGIARATTVGQELKDMLQIS